MSSGPVPRFSWRTARLVLLAGAAALVMALLLPRWMRIEFYTHLGLPWAVVSALGLSVVTLVWVRHWWKRADGATKQALKFDLLLAALGTLMITLVVPARSLIEADESALVLAAQGIQHTGTLMTPGMGVLDQWGVFHTSGVYLEKRGAFFPTLMVPLLLMGVEAVSAAHWVNLLALFTTLLFAARLGRRCGPAGGWLLPATLLGFPLVSVMARLGTFDALNLALWIATIHLGLGQCRAPQVARGWLLLATAACLAQIRYEAILPAAVSAALLMWLVVRGYATGHAQLVLAVMAPMVLVPATWRMAVPFSMELPPGVQSAWGSIHLADNLPALLRWTWTSASDGVGNWLIGLVALFTVLWGMKNWRTKSPGNRLAISFWLISMVPVMLLLQWSFWGEITYIVTARYYLFWCVALSALATWGLHNLLRPQGRRGAWFLTLLAAALVAHGTWSARQAEAFRFPYPEFRALALQAIEQAYGDCPVLVVHAVTAAFITRGYGSMDPPAWLANAQGLPSFLSQAGVVAVVAPSSLPDGLPPTFPAPLQMEARHWRVVFRSHGEQIPMTLYEVWRKPELSMCAPRAALQQVEPSAWRRAYEQWHLARPTTENL